MSNKRGVTLITIAIAVIVLLIILSTIAFNVSNRNEIQKLDDLYNNLTVLTDKVNIYYWKYGKLPVGEEYTQISNIPSNVLNPNDGDKYYIIDLSAINNLSIVSNINGEDLYVINEETHTVYFPIGISINGTTYYRLPTEYSTINQAEWDMSKVVDVVEEGTRKAPVPKGYVASSVSGEGTISGGLVIYQGTEEVNSTNHETAITTRNQFVWIPVDDINQMVMCKSNSSTSVCNLELQADGTLKCTKHNSTELCGRLYGTGSTSTTVDGKEIWSTSMDFTKRDQTWTSTGFREPDIVSDYDKDDATSGNNYMELAGIADKTVATFSTQLTNDFRAMAESVAKYGGFYIARYEAGENGASLKNQVVITASTSDGTVYKGVNTWYGLYSTLRSSTAVDKTVVSTHMVWRKYV